MLDALKKKDPYIQKRLDQLNAQYDFKDGIPKDNLFVKLRDDATREEANKVRFSLMQHINDISIYVEDRFSLEATFK